MQSSCAAGAVRGTARPAREGTREGCSSVPPGRAGDTNLNQADGEDDQCEQPDDRRTGAEVAAFECVVVEVTNDRQPAVGRAVALQKRVGQFEELVRADGAGDD